MSTDPIARLRRSVDAALAPCPWHGTSGGPHGPQPESGVGSCSQCERRHDGLVVSPQILAKLLDALEAAEAELAENEGVIQLLRRQRDAVEAENARLRKVLDDIETQLRMGNSMEVFRLIFIWSQNAEKIADGTTTWGAETHRILHPDNEGDET